MKAFSLIATILLSASSLQAITLATDSNSACVIVIPDDAIPAELTASRELREHLQQITGASFAINPQNKVVGRGAQIHVGPTATARKLLSDLDWKTLGNDGIVIRTFPDVLVLAGGRPRGTLNAVYTFLEDYAGVRWWTSSESTVPTSRTLALPDINVVYTPKFRYRETFNLDPNRHPQFAARLKSNGQHNELSESLGGHYEILGWCHSAYNLLPPATYFAAHPEWYSFRGGKRDHNHGQLCWTNTEMLAELTKKSLDLIREKPGAGIISISQNDWHGACECEKCAALDKEEGSAAGSLLFGVNAVAREIGKQYPDFLVETLAYQYTRKPPRNIRPEKNVLIRLCSIEADFTHPLASASNKSFCDDLYAWKSIADNLFIWNYVTNFTNYLIPHPNMLPLADDLRLFAENNVVGVFQQGDYHNALAGDFLPLRTWLIAHLLWDPSRDQETLRNEFMHGYYGAAAPYLSEYLELVNQPARDPGFRMGCYNRETSFLTDAAIERATGLFDKAAKAVASDPALSGRVRRERLALDQVKLLRYNFAPCIAAAEKAGDAACADYETLATDFVETARKTGVRSVSEAEKFDAYVPGLLTRCIRQIPPQLPAAGSRLSAGAFDIQEKLFRLHRPGEMTAIVDDPKASNGKAARMPGNNREWAIQFHVEEDAKYAARGPWRCFVVARCDAATTAGNAMQIGLHDTAAKRTVTQMDAPTSLAAGGKYHPFELTFDELKPGQYFWVCPSGEKNVEAVYVDRIFLRRLESTSHPAR